jgi:hypothetical protein
MEASKEPGILFHLCPECKKGGGFAGSFLGVIRERILDKKWALCLVCVPSDPRGPALPCPALEVRGIL